MPLAAELPIDTTATATQMMDELFGSDITIVSASYTGAAASSGIYSNGTTVMAGTIDSDSGVILSTGRATDFTNSTGDTNQASNTSTNMGTPGRQELSQLAGAKSFDAAVLESSFIPEGDTLTMCFVFASEEYLEFVNSGFNDVVGVWINGTLAEMTIGTGAVSIDNINTTSNSNLYLDNPAGSNNYNTEMDGLTVTLTIKAPVTPNEVNTIKIGIADAGDAAYDSNLLIYGNSITTTPIANDDSLTVNQGQTVTYDLLANDVTTGGTTLSVTKINGQPMQPGDSITFNTGETLTLNPDMTISITGTGWNTQTVFSYSITNSLGQSDTAFVTMTTPCFTAGSFIETPSGPVLIDDICAGDFVLTQSGKAEQVKWVGKTTRIARGKFAPIEIAPNTLGKHDAICISPQHRVVVSDARAELFTGMPETLVAAKHLVNDRTIKVKADGQTVTYIHLMFETHQIVIVNGLASESYYPGPETMRGFDKSTQDEILELFPQLDVTGYGLSAMPAAKGYEALALSAYI